jgi:protease I
MKTESGRGTKTRTLSGKRIAILVADGFEQFELAYPREALERAGATVEVVSLTPGPAKGRELMHEGREFPVDRIVSETKPAKFDALIVPGGEPHAATLRHSLEALEFIREFFLSGKPVGAIGDGLQAVLEASPIFETGIDRLARRANGDGSTAGRHGYDELTLVGRIIRTAPEDDLPTFVMRLIEEVATGIPMVTECPAEPMQSRLARPRFRNQYDGGSTMTLAQLVRRRLAHCRFVRSGTASGPD